MVNKFRLVALSALAIIVVVMALPVATVQAQPLKRWCKDMGGQTNGPICWILTTAMVETSLDVPPGLTLVNNSTINNTGTIGTSGTIINSGTINNNGAINNNGLIINCDGGTITGNEINGNLPETQDVCPEP